MGAAIASAPPGAEAGTVALQDFGVNGFIRELRLVVTLDNGGSSHLDLLLDMRAGLNLNNGGTNLGLPNRWFILPSGAFFDASYVASNPSWENNDPLNPNPPVSLDQPDTFPFFLGSWTDSDNQGNGDGVPGPGDTFAWAQLGPHVIQPYVTVELRDWRIDHTGTGLRVPEPSSGLPAVAFLFTVLRRRRS